MTFCVKTVSPKTKWPLLQQLSLFIFSDFTTKTCTEKCLNAWPVSVIYWHLICYQNDKDLTLLRDKINKMFYFTHA